MNDSSKKIPQDTNSNEACKRACAFVTSCMNFYIWMYIWVIHMNTFSFCSVIKIFISKTDIWCAVQIYYLITAKYPTQHYLARCLLQLLLHSLSNHLLLIFSSHNASHKLGQSWDLETKPTEFTWSNSSRSRQGRNNITRDTGAMISLTMSYSHNPSLASLL